MDEAQNGRGEGGEEGGGGGGKGKRRKENREGMGVQSQMRSYVGSTEVKIRVRLEGGGNIQLGFKLVRFRAGEGFSPGATEVRFRASYRGGSPLD